MAPPLPLSATTYTIAAELVSSSCPSCGYHIHRSSDVGGEAAEAHRRIHDLETQIRLLNSKAASAVDKLADYEDEIRYLRDVCSRSQQPGSSPASNSHSIEGQGSAAVSTPSAQQQQQQPPTLSRLASLSALLPGRRKDSTPQPPVTPSSATFPTNNAIFVNNALSPPKTPFSTPHPSVPTLQSVHSDSQVLTLSSLQTSLEEERTLRRRAESSLSQAQSELEELTAQLFGQANEMVATERKARVNLEERVKILEQRDADKRKRLERLEKAILRIERVRALVGPG